MEQKNNQSKKGMRIVIAGMLIVFIVGCFFGGRQWLLPARTRSQTADKRHALSQSIYTADSQSGYARLTASEQIVYAQFLKAAETHLPSVALSGIRLDVEAVKRVWQAFYQDNPQIFWVSGYRYTYGGANQIVSGVQLVYAYTQQEAQAKQRQIDTGAKRILAQIPKGADDYHTVLAVHDAIVKDTRYGSGSKDNQNIVSVLVDHESVCAGYSRAMQYLLKKAGIYCTVVDGRVASRGAHEWNLVKMDGDYYFVDVTWDDPTFEGGAPSDYVDHAFFGITTRALLKNHTIDAPLGEIATCEATRDNYFAREQRDYRAGESGKFLRAVLMARYRGEKIFSARFASADDMQKAVSRLRWLRLPGLRYVKREEMRVLTLLMP